MEGNFCVRIPVGSDPIKLEGACRNLTTDNERWQLRHCGVSDASGLDHILTLAAKLESKGYAVSIEHYNWLTCRWIKVL